MSNLEFLNYIATPTEKHLGIATIKYCGIILRYKIQKSEKGGIFAHPFATKVKDPVTQEEKWLKSHQIDSTSEHEKVDGFVRHSAQLAMNRLSAQPLSNIDLNNLPF